MGAVFGTEIMAITRRHLQLAVSNDMAEKLVHFLARVVFHRLIYRAEFSDTWNR